MDGIDRLLCERDPALIIAELSYNNGGVQLVKSFEGELFHGKMKQIFSWGVFIVYGLAIMIGVSGNINGGARSS